MFISGIIIQDSFNQLFEPPVSPLPLQFPES